jgi:hypothetical protein
MGVVARAAEGTKPISKRPAPSAKIRRLMISKLLLV